MQRRRFLEGVAGTTTAAGLAAADETSGRATDGTTRGVRGVRSQATQADTVPELYFDSTCSLLDADGAPLASDEHVAVRAADTATVTDEDGNGDAQPYGDAGAPALVAVADGAVGIGAPFVTDDTDFTAGNDEFLLNVWEELIGGGTVLWDEGHDQYYTADEFGSFTDRAAELGYTVESTTELTADLDGAAALVITSPSNPYTDAELSAIQSFRDDGGTVVLHSQSDYNNFDETDNINAVAAALALPFRFDDCQVVDNQNNAGSFFQPATTNFVGRDAFFTTRDGVATGPAFDPTQEYTAEIVEAADGDTFTVTFPDREGGEEEVRVLGVDTPEVPAAAGAEDPTEWEGLGDEPEGPETDGDYPYLSSWGEKASAFTKSELSAGTTVRLTFDENEGVRDPFGRLLAYASYDADGSGSRDTLWSRRLVTNGYARVYDSGHARHDDLLQAELSAREAGRGVWRESDPAESRRLRDGPVEQLVFPQAVTVGQFGGELPDRHVPVRAGDSASAAGAPLVGVDPANRVAALGGTLVGDDYVEEFDDYGNETFVTNLLRALSARDGDVLWDGGHGQFSADAGTSMEGASQFQRYLEGVDIGVEQVNDYGGALLERGQALLVTPPAESFGSEELSAIQSFRDGGGAVLLFGSAASADATERLNAVAAALGSSLTLDTDGVTDPETAAADEADVTTTTFGDAALFDAAADSEPAVPTATPTATPADTPTESPTPMATDSPTATATESSTGTEPSATATQTARSTQTTQTTGTATSAPGLGVLAGIAGAVGGGLAALAGDDAADDEE